MKKVFNAIIILLFIIRFDGVLAQDNYVDGSEERLYYDKKQNIFFDYNAVCDFTLPYLVNLESVISEKDWASINISSNNHKEHSKLEEYRNNGIKVKYLIKNKKIEVWDVYLEGKNVPILIRPKRDFLEKFKIHNLENNANNIELGCDGIVMNVNFNNDNLEYLSIHMSTGVI